MQIKNHKILHEIYRGAMTTVYKAQHLNLERPVLLKVLNKQWLQEQDLLERFQREARISAKLQHPNIVSVYDFEVSEDLVYLSLEFVEGQTLQEAIRKEQSMAFEQIQGIMKDIAQALDYAHHQGVIHRDIKPSNILLDENGTARLTDFGLASLHGSANVTVQGQLVGTPAYMAPELIRGSQANSQSDLYSLGITLFEMLTATSPFYNEQPAVTLQNVMHAKLPKVAELRDAVPENLKMLLDDLVQFEPARRPQNAGVILSYLQADNDTVHEGIHGGRTRRKRTRLVLPTFVLCALAILSAWIFWPRNEEKQLAGSKGQAQLELKSPSELIESPVEKTQESEYLYDDKTNEPSKKVSTISKPLPNHKIEPSPGSLFITCVPWATLLVNGDSLDTTPLKHAIKLPVGTHEVMLKNPNYETVRRMVDIKAGETLNLNFKLQPAFSQLMIQVMPWANIYINDKFQDTTPLQNALALPAGRHFLRLENPGFVAIHDTLVIESGKAYDKRYEFH